ncbi:MAG: redoxin domain-containing protein [Dysgonamonadaceae bacterium]|nr:redoxin domain-containing protein [Dysgonamonadaceae bacterium]
MITRKNKEQKELPEIVFTDIFYANEHILNDNNNQQTLIFFFDPGCDLCKDKILLFSENCEYLKKTRFFMISSAPEKSIKDFIMNNKISICENIYIYAALDNIIINEFENPINPSIYLYNKKGKLIRKFSYLTKINEIIDLLEN